MYDFLPPGSICAPLDFDLARRTDNLGVHQVPGAQPRVCCTVSTWPLLATRSVDIPHSVACTSTRYNSTIVLHLAGTEVDSTMTVQQKAVPLSPTVIQVLDEFVSAMQGDDAFDGDAIERLDEILRVGAVPKPSEIHRAMFQPQAGPDT